MANRKQKPQYDFTSAIFEGKLPPQAIDLEEAVLGALLLDMEAILAVVEILKPECFYKQEHQKIYAAIIDLYEASNPIDIKTVVMKLKSKGELEEVGGIYYVAKLTNSVASSLNVEYHSRLILQMFLKREMIRICGSLYNEAFSDESEVFELYDKAFTELESANNGVVNGKSLTDISSLTNDAIERYQKRKEAARENKITGMPTGLTDLNKITGGWQNSDLIILAARPSMGKTALALHFAISSGKRGLIMSLEMGDTQLTDRFMVIAADLDANKYRDGYLSREEEERLQTAKKFLDQRGIYIDDTPAVRITQIRAKAKKAKRINKIEYLILDYIQLADADADSRGNREQDISKISRGLKTLAKELNIPIIALSQLSRQCEQRPDKRPQLSDLRESGAIEQDADMVMFVYRPEFYGMLAANNEPIKGVGELIIAKHRNGKTTAKEELMFRYNQSLTKIYDYEEAPPPPPRVYEQRRLAEPDDDENYF